MVFPAPRYLGKSRPASQATTNNTDALNPASNWFHSYLKKQMTLSKRRGGWFRLEKRERSMFSLALRLNTSFKGYQLLKAMVGVLKKLMEVSDVAYSRLMRGVQMAWAFAEKCAEWGNVHAKEWRNDLEYARYLGSHMAEGKYW